MSIWLVKTNIFIFYLDSLYFFSIMHRNTKQLPCMWNPVCDSSAIHMEKLPTSLRQTWLWCSLFLSNITCAREMSRLQHIQGCNFSTVQKTLLTEVKEEASLHGKNLCKRGHNMHIQAGYPEPCKIPGSNSCKASMCLLNSVPQHPRLPLDRWPSSQLGSRVWQLLMMPLRKEMADRPHFHRRHGLLFIHYVRRS